MKVTSMTETVLILYNEISDSAQEDEMDVLHQVEAVAESLRSLNIPCEVMTFGLYSDRSLRKIKEMNPCCVFNLVESIDGKGSLVPIAPSFLSALGIPYTGAPAWSIFATSNKTLAKQMMKSHGIPTAKWSESRTGSGSGLVFPESMIFKSVWEHASIGLDHDAVVTVSSQEQLDRILEEREIRMGGQVFAESFIDGREFNVSIIESDQGPIVLPPAEMQFLDFFPDQPRIVGYRAKWDEESVEYKKTVRTFDFPPEDGFLLNQLREISLHCWGVFGLRGYARVDFRVDRELHPFVLEVNANPCLSKDAGFAAALGKQGISYQQAVRWIMEYAGI